jgi:hypothetical protein
VTLNPVQSDLLARAANRIKRRVRFATQDMQVQHRRWLLVDVDPLRSTEISSTDTELALALRRARAIIEYLTEFEWPAPILAMSGNGYHLLYRVNLPPDDQGLVKAVLAALADQFSDEAVAVDRAVHNPARIVKVIGTVARKGDDLRSQAGVEDRPHRRSEFIEVPEHVAIVPEALLRALAVANDRATYASGPAVANVITNGRLDCTPAGVRRWLEERGVVVKGERRSGDKTLLLLERCPINPEIVSTGSSDIAVVVCDDGKLAYCNKHNRGQDYTWHDLRKELDPGYEPMAAEDGTVDLSGFRVTARSPSPEHRTDTRAADDPGPLPEDLLRVPGFIGEVMDFCLQTAPYPNPVLAFGGSLALQALLAGRKVRDPGDNRTNVYILGLAHSSAGKDWPRKLNTRILHTVGLSRCLGERFVSGEGIQDALFADPAMLFQTDEIDSMLQCINKSRDARYENVMSTLQTLYTSSNSVYPMRRKAGREHPGVIDQPCLVIFGTAIPNHYYEALSERMLTNGFFARMLILESGPRGSGQDPSVCDVPPRVLETAKWWTDFRPGGGDLAVQHPHPATVEATRRARIELIEARNLADEAYKNAERASDAVAATVWGRTGEQSRKLALLHAVSENASRPRIDAAAARWGARLATYQARRMLFMAAGHVADNPFHAECLRLLKKLREAPGQRLPHHVLLKRMKVDAKSFQQIIDTLILSQEIVSESVSTKGRPGTIYQLWRSE